MTPWTYDDLLALLDRLGEQRIIPGLERMQEACARLGHPEGACPTIHIAGTNGKGSTGAFLRSILQASGARVAHYTSPHLTDFAERITVDGVPLAHAMLAAHGARIHATCADLPLTYFEYATLLAFAAFAEARPDVAIIEVGMGGRLDATNVITPRVSLITPIGLDHQAYLGDTIAAIAREKCGIIKPGVPVVSAPQTPEVMAAIRATCADREATLTLPEPVGPDVALGLPGAHQRINAGVAASTAIVWCQVPYDAHLARLVRYLAPYDVTVGLARANWPGRCEWLSHDPPILFDGAHNVSGAEALATYIADVRQGRSVTCVLGVMQDKDAAGIVAALRPVVDRFIAVTPPTSRALPAEALAAIIETEGAAAEVGGSVKMVLTHARKHANTQTPLVIITGSLALYAPVSAWLSGSRAAG